MLKNFAKSSTKLLRSPCPIMLLKFITRGALKGHSRSKQKALQHSGDIQRALQGHLGTQGTQALWHSKGTWAHAGTQDNQALEQLRPSSTWRALGHSGTQGARALRYSKGNGVLRHSGTWALKALPGHYLANSTLVHPFFIMIAPVCNKFAPHCPTL